MPRLAVPITELPSFMVGANLTGLTGQADDESVDLGKTPVAVLMTNKNAATVDVTLELPASSVTFNKAASIPHTIPAAVGGVEGKRAFMADVSAVKQSDGALHIDSADPNIADVTFYAFTWVKTAV